MTGQATGSEAVRWQTVARLAGAPAFVLPWLDRFYEPADVDLLEASAEAPLTAAALGRRLQAAAPQPGGAAFAALLDRAYRRAVLDRSASGRYSPASFHDRFVVWIFFEGWLDLPEDVRESLREWELGWYVEQTRPYIEAVLAGDQIDPIENETYLLMHEVEEVLRAQPHIYLFPCDCRAIMGRCDKPTLNCLRFEGEHGNWHGLGWEISQERAIEIAREANRRGLMQTGHEPGKPSRAICNCCPDCCFPHLVAERLGSAKVWPRSRYVARVEAAGCDGCNRCVARCPFDAVARSAAPAAREAAGAGSGVATIDEELCRGCGLCAAGCPQGVIVMDPLADANRHST